jgi:hypothetical protein
MYTGVQALDRDGDVAVHLHTAHNRPDSAALPTGSRWRDGHVWPMDSSRSLLLYCANINGAH